MKHALVASTAVLLVLPAGVPAAAQSVDARPSNTVALRAGFAPDPHEVRVQAGGPRYTATALTDCRAGYVPEAPHLRLDYTAGDAPLNITADAEGDTTLVVNTPDGRWLCNDDGPGGLDPAVSIERPTSGRYLVWVGRYSGEGGTEPATLRVSAQAPGPAADETDSPPAARTPPPDPELPPAQGVLDLRTGFAPNPTVRPVQAGGSTDSSGLEGCNGGYVSQAPAVRLNYTAGSAPLVLSVSSQADTTLVVRTPDGRWTCNDDSVGSVDPQVAFERPASGRYDVFVGRFGVQGQTAPATLRVSATPPPPPPAEEPEPPEAPAGVRRPPNLALRPTYGSLALRTGFKPDPAAVAVHAGGPLDASALGDSCNGLIAEAASVRLTFTAGPHPLSFSVRGGGDTTLAIRGPDGVWTCNDDSEGLNPRVTYQRPRTGRYDVFVGTFGGANLPPATLRVSEMVDLSEPSPGER